MSTSEDRAQAYWAARAAQVAPAAELPAAPAPHTVKPGWVIGLGALASLVLGIVLVAAGTISQSSSSTPGTLRAFGVILLVLALAGGFACACIGISKGLARERAWKATLTPDQRLAVNVAETAALYATWAAVHHGSRRATPGRPPPSRRARSTPSRSSPRTARPCRPAPRASSEHRVLHRRRARRRVPAHQRRRLGDLAAGVPRRAVRQDGVQGPARQPAPPEPAQPPHEVPGGQAHRRHHRRGDTRRRARGAFRP